jgi:hypothetical protein
VGFTGLRALAEEFGMEAELRGWWASVRADYSPPKQPVDPGLLDKEAT